MRKLKYVIFILVSLSALLSCTKKGVAVAGSNAGSDSLSSFLGSPDDSQPASSGGIDYDFSDMNYNLINAMNFEMAINPEAYYGKKIKMRGQFFSAIEPDSQKRFYYCVVYDPTACCQAGLDFVMEDKVYPDDFPEEEAYIEIVGTFEDFSEFLNDGRSYAGIRCESLKVLDKSS